jgi:hypothetical protein
MPKHSRNNRHLSDVETKIILSALKLSIDAIQEEAERENRLIHPSDYMQVARTMALYVSYSEGVKDE